jgi:hypothetical protein
MILTADCSAAVSAAVRRASAPAAYGLRDTDMRYGLAKRLPMLSR